MIWRKERNKNRRVGRDYVLDVKLRSSQVRAARVRMAAMGLGLLFITVFGIYLLWRTGDWALDRFLYQNTAFAIQDIDIQTDGVISTEEFRRWGSVKQGMNLLALDLAKVKRDLELVPFIENVSVDRILPRTLRIRVTEREPVAKVTTPQPGAAGGIEMVTYKLDAMGWVMMPLDPRQRANPSATTNDMLPAIVGVRPSDLSPGRQLESAQVKAALELITSFERSPIANYAEIKSVDVSVADVLILVTVQGAEITFGMKGFDQQLLRWDQINQVAQRAGKTIASLDLAVSNNVPARWMEAAVIMPLTPKLPKPAHYRKKHV